MAIIGIYNNLGYQILSLDKDGQIVEEVYAAGNNRNSSATSDSVPPDNKNAVPPQTLIKWCRKESKDFAKERGEEFLGVEQEDT